MNSNVTGSKKVKNFPQGQSKTKQPIYNENRSPLAEINHSVSKNINNNQNPLEKGSNSVSNAQNINNNQNPLEKGSNSVSNAQNINNNQNPLEKGSNSVSNAQNINSTHLDTDKKYLKKPDVSYHSQYWNDNVLESPNRGRFKSRQHKRRFQWQQYAVAALIGLPIASTIIGLGAHAAIQADVHRDIINQKDIIYEQNIENQVKINEKAGLEKAGLEKELGLSTLNAELTTINNTLDEQADIDTDKATLDQAAGDLETEETKLEKTAAATEKTKTGIENGNKKIDTQQDNIAKEYTAIEQLRTGDIDKESKEIINDARNKFNVKDDWTIDDINKWQDNVDDRATTLEKNKTGNQYKLNDIDANQAEWADRFEDINTQQDEYKTQYEDLNDKQADLNKREAEAYSKELIITRDENGKLFATLEGQENVKIEVPSDVLTSKEFKALDQDNDGTLKINLNEKGELISSSQIIDDSSKLTEAEYKNIYKELTEKNITDIEEDINSIEKEIKPIDDAIANNSADIAKNQEKLDEIRERGDKESRVRRILLSTLMPWSIGLAGLYGNHRINKNLNQMHPNEQKTSHNNENIIKT